MKCAPNLSSLHFAEEMDWDRNGKVSFREFLFALISWVGIDPDDEASDRELLQASV